MEYTSNSADRQQFEAVWKRVTASSEAPSVVLSTAVMDNKTDEPNLPEADDTVLLKQFIADETYILNSYRSLACRLSGNKFSIVLLRLYAQEKETLKKLQAAYFILTGSSFKAEFYKPPKGTLLNNLYVLYWKETNSAKAYEAAAENTRSNKLPGLYLTISAYKKNQTDELEELIGRFIK